MFQQLEQSYLSPTKLSLQRAQPQSSAQRTAPSPKLINARISWTGMIQGIQGMASLHVTVITVTEILCGMSMFADVAKSFVQLRRKALLQTMMKKTRCSPRTRMLTRMLMVQMSKHMDMQSPRTLFCNSVFEQSCTYFPCFQSAVWSVECKVWSVKCRVWSVKCGVWSVKCRVWSVGWKV